MNKKRFLAAIMAILMVFVSVPLDSIKVQAALDGNVKIEGGVVTGYEGEKSTVTRIVIPKDATSVASNAFDTKNYPELKEVVVLNDSITIADNSFGEGDACLATKDGFTMWCSDKNSTAYEFMNKKAYANNVKFLNTEAIKIYTPGNESDKKVTQTTYYSGCEAFDLSVELKGVDGNISEDIIWSVAGSYNDESGSKDVSSLDNSPLYFMDGNNKVSETSGDIIKKEDGTAVSTVKVYVKDTASFYEMTKSLVKHSIKQTITATSRGRDVSSDSVEITVNEATSSITPTVRVFKIKKGLDENGNFKYDTINITEKDKDGNDVTVGYKVKVDEVTGEALTTAFDKNNLYIDTDYIFLMSENLSSTCEEHIVHAVTDNDIAEVVYGKKISDTLSDSVSAPVMDMVNSNGESIYDNEDDLYESMWIVKPGDFNFTILSGNMILSKIVKINACKEARSMKLYIDKTEITGGRLLYTSKTYELSAELEPSDSTDTVVWTTSNDAAKINDGNKLTANSTGEAVITCSVKSSKSGERLLSRSVKVYIAKTIPYNEIEFVDNENNPSIIKEYNICTNSVGQLYINDAKNGELIITSDASTKANEDVIYTSDNTNIVSVDNSGKLIAGSNTGTATVTVQSASDDKKSKTIQVNVYSRIEEINVKNSYDDVPLGQTIDYTYTVNPASATELITWKSVNYDIADVEEYIDENGNRKLRITGKNIGGTSAKGTGIASGYVVSTDIKVVEPVHADTISLTPVGSAFNISTDENGKTVYNVAKGTTFTLIADMKSASGVKVNDQAKWSSDIKNSIATLSTPDNKTLNVEAKDSGKFEVTFTATGYDASTNKEVTKQSTVVINIYVPATDIEIRANNSIADTTKVTLGDTIQLTGVLIPGDSSDSIKWETDNDNVSLSVDTTVNNGNVVVTANKVGKTIVKAKIDSRVVDTIEVNVIIPAKSIKFVQDGIEVDKAYVSAGGEKTLSLNVLDADTTDTTFTWTTSLTDSYIKLIPSEDGKTVTIKGLAKGSQNVIVTAPSGVTATIPVNVVIPATELSLNSDSITLYKGDQVANVIATLAPSGTTDVVRWSLDKEGIVEIRELNEQSTDSAKVLEVNPVDVGTVVLTATTVSGLCKSVNIEVKAREIENVTIADIEDVVYTGIGLTPYIVVSNDGMDLMKDRDYTCEYNNNINVGLATVTIKGIGNYAGTKSATFNIVPKNISDVSNTAIEEIEYNGKANTPTFELSDNIDGTIAKLELDKDYTVEYTNNINVGEATIVVSGKGNYNGTTNISFSIKAKDISLAKDIVVDEISSKKYTGDVLTPIVSVKDGTTTMKVNTDYVVEYFDNINVGEATATITGIGNYTNSCTAKFNITKASISKAKISNIEKQIYTGSSLTPSASITVNGREIYVGTDCTVKYSNNKNPGKATIKFTGEGNYSGSVSKTFIILPLATTKASMSKNSSSSVTLKWNKVTGASGYEIYVYDQSKAKYKKLTTSTKNTVTIKKLKAGTNYLFGIYSYVLVGGKKYLSTELTQVAAVTKTKTPAIKKLSSDSSQATVEFKSVTGANGYEIYTSSSKKGKYKLALTTSSLSETIKGLKPKKKCYVKVRAYITLDGENYYSSYSSVKSVKIKA